jgi:hypothetical protein
MQELRFDRAPLKVIETGEGFLKARVTFAVPGVFPYLYADGFRQEAKLPEDILSQSTIQSAAGAPITDDHPTDSEGKYIFVDSQNYKEFSKGNISEPKIENGVGVALATIYDPVLIEEIKQKKKDSVSIGFICDTHMISGVYDGKKYDAQQKNIKINHLACVDIARSGGATKIHVDRGINMSDINIAAGAGNSTPDDTNKSFSYRKFDGSKDVAVSQEIHSELMTLRNQIKADQDQIESLKSELAQIQPSIPDPEGQASKEELMAKLENLQAEVMAWKEKYSQLEEAVPEMADEMAEEKAQVLDAAKAMDEEIAVDGLSTKEIKMQIISKGLPFKDGIKVDGLSDEIINARYDAAIDLLKARANMPKGNEMQKSTMKIDRSSVEEKRMKLQNMYKGVK